MFCCLSGILVFFFVFFFQAEDGIRDATVTGVQTCALPISIGQLDTQPSSTSATISRHGIEFVHSSAGRSGAGVSYAGPSSTIGPSGKLAGLPPWMAYEVVWTSTSFASLTVEGGSRVRR